MPQLDPHSYNDSAQTDVRSFDWNARVDFKQRILDAEITLHLAAPSEGPLDLDTRDLHIAQVANERGEAIPFELFAPEPILGARLRLILPPNTSQVTLQYRTSPSSSALQWLEPAQTSGGKQPFLYSQCQAIHARSVIPIQDTPRVRVTFRAALTVPQALRSVMAARSGERVVLGDVATDYFEMPQPIPPYLLALAVGDLVSQDVGPRSRVWAEPAVVDDAAWEFADVEKLIVTAEKLFGPYEWERFDILTMPPSFPYGGMENPRLTFLTPTLLAKDRSLVHVLAHELAHSWTGNLVTNANAEHFWLNEGFTVFAERRILEAVEDPEMSAFHAALGLRSLERALVQFRQRPEHTRLRTELVGVDPDDVFSQVPYEKGYLFLRALENAVGRDKFDHFLQAYVTQYRFKSLTTEDFVQFLEKALPGAYEKVEGRAWIHEPGLPANAPRPSSERLEALQAIKDLPDEAAAQQWTPAEWQLYLENIPRPISPELCANLEQRYHLTESQNSEILVAWLTLAVEANDAKAVARAEEYLGRVGRLKYVKPLYQALINSRRGRTAAQTLFNQVKNGYHPITASVVESLLRLPTQ